MLQANVFTRVIDKDNKVIPTTQYHFNNTDIGIINCLNIREYHRTFTEANGGYFEIYTLNNGVEEVIYTTKPIELPIENNAEDENAIKLIHQMYDVAGTLD